VAIPSPWDVLADTDLVLDRQPIEELGRYYANERAIVVRAGLLLVEERSVLWHELAHHARGDRRCDSGDRDERHCEQLAARMAIPLHDLVNALRTSHDVDEAADQLKATPGLLRTRMEGLDFRERAHVRRQLEES
jgi:hypothetical protein